MAASAHSGSPWMKPVMTEMAAAMSSMMTIGSPICSKKRFHMGVFLFFVQLVGTHIGQARLRVGGREALLGARGLRREHLLSRS